MARMKTPEAILSYPNLFQPRAASEGADPKYSCTLIFTEGTDISELKKAAIAKLKEKWGDKTAAMLKAGSLNTPFRTDTEAKGYPAGTFINVRSNDKPGVVTLVPGSDGKPSVLTDESKIYAGAIVRATIDPYWYDKSGNKGVTFGLGNVQLIRDGDRLDGRASAEDEFDADPDSVADLSDLDTGEAPAEVTEDEDQLADLLG